MSLYKNLKFPPICLFLAQGPTCCRLWQVPRCGRGRPSAWPSLHPWQPWCCLQFRLQSPLVPGFSLLAALLCLDQMGLAGWWWWCFWLSPLKALLLGTWKSLCCSPRLWGQGSSEVWLSHKHSPAWGSACFPLCSAPPKHLSPVVPLFLGTLFPASFLFLPLEQGSFSVCACSSHPFHTASSQGLGFRSSSPLSIFWGTYTV